jgi:hypothetical protein
MRLTNSRAELRTGPIAAQSEEAVMIRTMQLVAELANKRPRVGFRSNFEKMD